MNFRRNFHENFQGIFKKIITEKSLVTQNMFMKIPLEIQEISCKEISFLMLLNFNLFMKFHVEILVFSWTKI